MAEKKRLAMYEEQKAKKLQSQQKQEDAEARRKEKIDQKKIAAEEASQKTVQVNERKKLYDEVMSLYTYLCKKENLWECLETGIQWRNKSDIDVSKLTPFDRIKRKLLQDYEILVFLNLSVE